MNSQTALLFPGPGSHLPGALAPFAVPGSSPRESLDIIDDIARSHGWAPVSPGLTGTVQQSESVDQALLWLGFYASSVVVSHLLDAAGLEARVLVGHSGGEISALTAAGALTVADGAAVLVERVLALKRHPLAAGAMTAVRAPAHRVRSLCSAVGDPSLRLAVDNSPQQSVVCGHAAGVTELEQAAAALGWRTTRLAMPFPLHNPLLAGAAEDFLDAVSTIELRAPQRPLYSPLLGRPVLTRGDVHEVLAVHLMRPVRFGAALTALQKTGIEAYVECGARRVLTDLVSANLPHPVRSLAPLAVQTDEDGMRQLLGTLAAGAPAAVTPRQEQPMPVAPAPEARGEAASAEAPPAARGEAAPGKTPAVSGGTGLPEDEESFQAELRAVYAAVLQYPEEVFAPDAQLEGELGVSSIKQTEIFARLLDQYDLPTPPSDTRVSAHRTLRQVSGLLRKIATAD